MYIKGDTMIIEEVSIKNQPLSRKVTGIYIVKFYPYLDLYKFVYLNFNCIYIDLT